MTMLTEYYTTEARAAGQAASTRYAELREQGIGDPFTDHQWCQHRIRELSARVRLMESSIDERAREQRTAAHKRLGKEYGKASDRIRRLKGEVAILRRALREGRLSNGMDVFAAENERLIAENEELRRVVEQKQQTIQYYRTRP